MNPEQLFNQNFAAIAQAKQQTGDWEKAYQMVTGQTWPKGQDIKIGPDGGHMVKDPGLMGKFLKYAIPVGAAVAAPFTGGATLALIGAGAGAASGALNGGGWKGALMGAGLGAAGGIGGKYIGQMLGKAGVPGLSGAASGTGSGGIGDFVGPTLEQAGKAPAGSTIASIMQNANVPMGKLITDPNAVNGVSGSSSIWDKIVGAGKNILHSGGQGNTDENGGDQKWADAATVLDDMGKGELARRYIKGNMTQNYDQINMEAAKTNAAMESDALKKLAQTSYLAGGGARPMNFQVNSGRMPDFGFGPQAASPAQIQGANTLQASLLKRLTPEGQIKPTDPSYLNEGAIEKVGKYGGYITGGIGAVKNIFGQ